MLQGPISDVSNVSVVCYDCFIQNVAKVDSDVAYAMAILGCCKVVVLNVSSFFRCMSLFSSVYTCVLIVLDLCCNCYIRMLQIWICMYVAHVTIKSTYRAHQSQLWRL